jgi:hypothetical protein
MNHLQKYIIVIDISKLISQYAKTNFHDIVNIINNFCNNLSWEYDDNIDNYIITKHHFIMLNYSLNNYFVVPFGNIIKYIIKFNSEFTKKKCVKELDWFRKHNFDQRYFQSLKRSNIKEITNINKLHKELMIYNIEQHNIYLLIKCHSYLTTEEINDFIFDFKSLLPKYLSIIGTGRNNIITDGTDIHINIHDD